MARKLGCWNADKRTFDAVPWLPVPQESVIRLPEVVSAFDADSIGGVPKTGFALALRVKELVTHNAAILGILGIGKTTLALEMIRRVAASGVRVICLDITNQYRDRLGCDECDHEAINQSIAATRDEIDENVAENGGNESEFRDAIRADLEAFLGGNGPGAKVYNPEAFDVTRQGKRGFKPIIETLTVAQTTQIIAQLVLECLKGEIVDEARALLVFEEAHSLIPEWTSVSQEGDKAATNATAKAILQGRKYGLGCLVITQRTANVIKSILNQCNTIFAFRTFDHTGMEFLRNYIGDDYTAVLSTLAERHVVAFGRGVSTTNPVILRVNESDDFEPWWGELGISLRGDAQAFASEEEVESGDSPEEGPNGQDPPS